MIAAFIAASIAIIVSILDFSNILFDGESSRVQMVVATIMWYPVTPPTNFVLGIVYLIFVYHLYNRLEMTRKVAAIYAVVLLIVVALDWPVQLILYDWAAHPNA